MRAARLVGFGVVALRACLADHAPAAADALLAACALVLVALELRTHRPRVVVVVAVSVATLAALVSLPGSWHATTSVLCLGTFACPLAFLLLGAVVGERDRSFLLAGLVAGACVHASVALAQRFISWPDALARRVELALTAGEIERMTSLRPIGLSLSPDLGGALCVLGALAALWLFLEHRADKRARALLAAVALCAGGALVSRSFGVGLSALAAVGTAVLVGARSRALVIGGAAAAVVVVGAVVARGVSSLGTSASERLINWDVALSLFGSHPLAGVGVFRFAPAYLAARPPDGNITRYAHGLVPQWLAEMGVLGGGASVTLGVVVIAALWQRERVLPLCAAVFCLARFAIDYDAHVAQVGALAFLVIGMAGAPVERGAPRPSIAAAIGALLLGLLAIGLAVRAPRVDAFKASAGVEPNLDDERALERWLALAPGDLEASASLSTRRAVKALACRDRCEVLVAEAKTALEATRAIGHAPPTTHTLLAQLTAREGDHERARALLDEALTCDPGHATTHRLRVQLAPDEATRARAIDDAKRWLPAAVVDAW